MPDSKNPVSKDKTTRQQTQDLNASLLVLLVPPLEPQHPRSQHFFRGWVQLGPHGRQLTIIERV